MDAYLCLLHLTAALVLETLFNAFATAAFFEFVIFAIFEMRFLLLVWRAQRPGGLSDVNAARRDLGVLYMRFYGALLGGIFLAYHLQVGTSRKQQGLFHGHVQGGLLYTWQPQNCEPVLLLVSSAPIAPWRVLLSHCRRFQGYWLASL